MCVCVCMYLLWSPSIHTHFHWICGIQCETWGQTGPTPGWRPKDPDIFFSLAAWVETSSALESSAQESESEVSYLKKQGHYRILVVVAVTSSIQGLSCQQLPQTFLRGRWWRSGCSIQSSTVTAQLQPGSSCRVALAVILVTYLFLVAAYF